MYALYEFTIHADNDMQSVTVCYNKFSKKNLGVTANIYWPVWWASCKMAVAINNTTDHDTICGVYYSR